MWFPISNYLISKIKELFEHVHVNKATNTTEIGNNLKVDGDITISDGNLTIGEGAVSTPILTSTSNHIGAQKPVIEVMTGYSATASQNDLTWTPIYVSCCKNGNKVTFAVLGSFEKTSATSNTADIVKFVIPSEVSAKLYPYTIGPNNSVLGTKSLDAQSSTGLEAIFPISFTTLKYTGSSIYFRLVGLQSLTDGTYFFRIEETLLLSDNLA